MLLSERSQHRYLHNAVLRLFIHKIHQENHHISRSEKLITQPARDAESILRGALTSNLRRIEKAVDQTCDQKRGKIRKESKNTEMNDDSPATSRWWQISQKQLHAFQCHKSQRDPRLPRKDCKDAVVLRLVRRQLRQRFQEYEISTSAARSIRASSSNQNL